MLQGLHAHVYMLHSSISSFISLYVMTKLASLQVFLYIFLPTLRILIFCQYLNQQNIISFYIQAIATDSPNEATGFMCRQLHVPYFRFNPSLSEKVDIKEVKTEILIKKLILETKKYCSEMEVSDQLAHVVQLLHAAVKANQTEATYHSSISENSSKN